MNDKLEIKTRDNNLFNDNVSPAIVFKNEGIHVVYGSYKVKENAEKEVERLIKLGYQPRIIFDESASYHSCY